MLKINEQRLLDNLAALGEIGATADGGVSRPALSEADIAGRNWFKAQVEAAGLDYREDGAANQSAILRASDEDAKTLLVGSHLDSVPNGGRYDGALGVLAAFEAVQTIKETGRALPVNLEVVAFTDEEGALMGLMGSQAMAGLLSPAAFENPRGGLEALEAGMARAGLTRESVLDAKRDPDDLMGFLELHIEQGTRLEEVGLQIGVVSSIVGIRSFWLHFGGQAAHAGTMPMVKRKDAFWGVTDFVQRARAVVMDQFTPGVVNFGQVRLEPGGFNIVPAQAHLAMEFRHGTEAQLDTMQSALLTLAEEVAGDYGLALEVEPAMSVVAAPMDETMVQAIERAADQFDLDHTRLMSFAGHDTQAVSRLTPSAMFFVPSVDGISHNPDEYTRDEDVVNGANVMLGALLALAESG